MSGSFIKLPKLDFGIQLNSNTIRARYVENDAPLVAPDGFIPGAFALTKRGATKPIELCGEAGIRSKQQVGDLNSISLRANGIWSVFISPVIPPNSCLKDDVDYNRNDNFDNNDCKDSSSTCSHSPDILQKPQHPLTEEFGHLKEMDLAGNLLGSWKEAFKIVNIFPLLTSISFASNRLLDILSHDQVEDEDNNGSTTDKNRTTSTMIFPLMKTLNINNCSVRSFETILRLGKIFPNLDKLSILGADLSDATVVLQDKVKTKAGKVENEYNDGDCKPEFTSSSLSELVASTFPNLRFLDVSGCNISSWKDHVLNPYSLIPNLEILILDDNSLSRVDKNDDVKDLSFPSLVSLYLGGNNFNNWAAVDTLSMAAPKLHSLRFRDNPVSDRAGAGDARCNVIARLPDLEILNASKVTKKERLESERRYVSSVAREILLATTKARIEGDVGEVGEEDENKICQEEERIKSDVLLRHPRFGELIKIHGDSMLPGAGRSDGSSLFGIGGKGLSSSMSSCAVNVIIRSMAAGSCTMGPLRKRLPGTLTIARMKAMCGRAFNLEPSMQLLHFRAEGEVDAFPIEMDDDDCTLSYYGIFDGAEILVNEIEDGKPRWGGRGRNDVDLTESDGYEKSRRKKLEEDQEREGEVRRAGMLALSGKGGSGAIENKVEKKK